MAKVSRGGELHRKIVDWARCRKKGRIPNTKGLTLVGANLQERQTRNTNFQAPRQNPRPRHSGEFKNPLRPGDSTFGCGRNR